MKSKDARIKYPWDEWLDGREVVLRPGKDFTCSIRSMIVWTYSVAAKRKKRVSINEDIRRGSVVLILVARPMTRSEVTQREIRRAKSPRRKVR